MVVYLSELHNSTQYDKLEWHEYTTAKKSHT